MGVYYAQGEGFNLTDTQNITTRSGIRLLVEQRTAEQTVEVLFRAEGKPGFVLHWGLRHRLERSWQLPPPSL